MKYHVYRFRYFHSKREHIKTFDTLEEAQALCSSVEGSSDTTVKNKDLIKTIGHWFLAWTTDEPAPPEEPSEDESDE